jgi:hypothetical protein
MSETTAELNLIFNESGENPLVLESTWIGAPNRENPDLKEVGHAKKRLGALAILFLLAKYRENRPMSELNFQVDIERLTWICTLSQNFEDVKKWIIKHFHIPEHEMFIASEYGTTHTGGGLAPPSVRFLAENLSLKNVHLYQASRQSILTKEPLAGRKLLDLALKIEAKHWPHSQSAIKILEATGDVREFLVNLAEKGLAKRMLFPPPLWEGRSLREFCLEPKLITEVQWEKHKKEKPKWAATGPHDMELATEKTMREQWREKVTVLSRVLGDEHHPTRHRRVILRGNPGEGKSTSLWIYVGNQCTSLISQLDSGELGIDDAAFNVPLVFSLGDVRLDKADLTAIAIENVLKISCGNEENATVKVLRKWLRSKVKRSEYTLALDALDELSVTGGGDGQTWLRQQIQDIPHSVTILLTTRPNTIDTTLGLNIGQSSGEFAVYRMTCFDNAQITKYVRGYFGVRREKAESLLTRLQQSPGPKQLAQLPLLLAVLCHVHDANDPDVPLPSTRTDLLGTALRRLFDLGRKKRALKFEEFRQPDPLRDRLKEILLEHVAWKFWNDGPVPMEEGDLHAELRNALIYVKKLRSAEYSWARERAKQVKLSRIIEEFCGDGILVQMLAGGRNHYRFVLRSIHEYLIAGYFASEPKRQIEKRIALFVLRADWLDDNWRYIWPLAAGQGPHIAKQLLSIFDQPEKFVYGGVGFDKIFPEFLGNIVSESKSPESSNWVSKLIKCAGEQPRVNASIVGAIGEIGGLVAEKTLFDWLFDESDSPLIVSGSSKTWMPNHISEALAKTASHDTTNILIQRLNDPALDREYRGLCAMTLGEIGDILSRDALIDCMCNTSGREYWDRDRWQCARALGEIGDAQSRDALIARLKNSSNDEKGKLRYCCAVGLATIGDKESIRALIDQTQNVTDDMARLIGQKCAEMLDVVG